MIKQFYKNYLNVLRVSHWVTIVCVLLLCLDISDFAKYSMATICIAWIWIAAIATDTYVKLLKTIGVDKDD